MTQKQRHKWYADSLRNKYSTILSVNGELTDDDYEQMTEDAKACTDKDPSSRSAILDVLEEFDRKFRERKS